MWVKLFLSTIIIVTSFKLASIYASTFTNRKKQLGDLIIALQMLETEINYTSTPIPFMLDKIGNRLKSEVSMFLLTTAGLLKDNNGYSFMEAWNIAIDSEGEKTSLNNEDLEILKLLGNNLGATDTENQVKYIRILMEEVKRHYKMAIEDEEKNLKLYKYLGLLAGFTIVIILF